MPVYEYDTNNSGGDWWLSDEDWYNLETAGWEVDWYAKRDSKWMSVDSEGRWLGGLAGGAKKEFPSRDMAIAEWQCITGQDYYAEGCLCCGPPHSISKEYVYNK